MFRAQALTDLKRINDDQPVNPNGAAEEEIDPNDVLVAYDNPQDNQSSSSTIPDSSLDMSFSFYPSPFGLKIPKVDLTRPRSERHEPVTERAQPSTSSQQLVCQCCFDDIVSNSSSHVACAGVNDLHPFCLDCVRRYAEEWVFGGTIYPLSQHADKKYLPCLSSDCKGGHIPEESVRTSVSPTIFSQYVSKMLEEKSKRSVSSTESIPTDVSRARGSPRTSGKSTLDESYHVAEEALTDAKVRKCSVCHTRFLKEEDSCNKMRCPSCRYCTCYICRQPVESKGYDHFCTHEYDTSCERCDGSCPLWSRRDDARDSDHLREVAHDLANRLWEESLLNGNDIRIDVERLL